MGQPDIFGGRSCRGGWMAVIYPDDFKGFLSDRFMGSKLLHRVGGIVVFSSLRVGQRIMARYPPISAREIAAGFDGRILFRVGDYLEEHIAVYLHLFRSHTACS